MRQGTLFEQIADDPDRTTVRFTEQFNDWRPIALAHAIAGIEPDSLHWQPVAVGSGERLPSIPRSSNDQPQIRVPKAFRDLARSVSVHSAPDRWDFLYRCLWRIASGERYLLEMRADPMVRRLYVDAAAVRRCVHKMHAFVRFRRVDCPDGERYIAWFEPDHPVLRHTANFFQNRFFNMRWSILTPELSAHWEGSGEVWFSPGARRDNQPSEDEFEGAWRSYYRSIFNPARLKVTAMRSEMPQKYWRNLPEAADIPQLIQSADHRTHNMVTAPSSDGTLQCGPRPAPFSEVLDEQSTALGVAEQVNTSQRLELLSLSLQSCQSCPLWEHATQPVPGAGPADARVMLIGEQPGDREDLAGKPFVGPAGELLDRALIAAGLDRQQLYLTNAVKHFKFRVRGKRRIHDRPREREIHACNQWLMEEIGLIDPAIIVCLGATAARALFGPNVSHSDLRGRTLEWESRQVVVTAHPAAILRGAGASDRAFDALVRDLRLVTL